MICSLFWGFFLQKFEINWTFLHRIFSRTCKKSIPKAIVIYSMLILRTAWLFPYTPKDICYNQPHRIRKLAAFSTEEDLRLEIERNCISKNCFTKKGLVRFLKNGSVANNFSKRWKIFRQINLKLATLIDNFF